MKFIELHRHSDGRPMLINLNEIACIRPGNDSECAIVEWRGDGKEVPMRLPTVESYRDIKGMMSIARIIAR